MQTQVLKIYTAMLVAKMHFIFILYYMHTYDHVITLIGDGFTCDIHKWNRDQLVALTAGVTSRKRKLGLE